MPVRERDGSVGTAPISAEDYGPITLQPLRINADGYVVFSRFDAGKRKSFPVLLHRVLARAEKGELVDHKNGNRRDNRRRNLRRANHSQNTVNRTVLLPNKSSRYRGVTKHTSGLWQAQCKKGKNYYCGLHRTEEAAAEAYNRKAVELHGAFARLNRTRRAAAQPKERAA